MAIRFSMVTSLVLFLFLFYVSSSYATQVVEVSVICRKAKNPSFCLGILTSKPGGEKGADLITLAEYTIDVARANITHTIKLIKFLIANASDPSAKDHYKMCLTHFTYDEGALGDLEYAEKMLKSRDYGGLNVAAAAIATDADDCVSGESPSDPPYHDPSPLPKYADVLEQVVEIIMIISNFLVKK